MNSPTFFWSGDIHLLLPLDILGLLPSPWASDSGTETSDSFISQAFGLGLNYTICFPVIQHLMELLCLYNCVSQFP
jgi:hypothetical protein